MPRDGNAEARELPTVGEVRAYFSCDPLSGIFGRRILVPGPRRADGSCGSINKKGYRYITFKGRLIKAHRLAWLYFHGEWPVSQIDHANGKRDDNRISNLHLATNSLNMANRKVNDNSSSGTKGVSFHSKKNKWIARIQINGLRREVGSFSMREEARQAYDAEAIRLFGEFARAV